MTIPEIIDLIMNNGLSIVCVAYMIYFQNNTMKDLTDALNKLKDEISNTNTRLSIIESKIDENK